jgi:ribonucleoside-diphosphate reductase alpha chain
LRSGKGNHKVVRIVEVTEEVPAYCGTVPTTGRFFISFGDEHREGVLVSNCWKVREEAKAAAMYVGSEAIARGLVGKSIIPQAILDREENGFELEVFGVDWEGEAIRSVDGQNSNNSVRITNDFLGKVDAGGMWHLKERVTGKDVKALDARNLWLKICRAAWASADPGVLFADTINEWHTCAADGPILACNPCGEYQFLDDTACNLASLRLVQFLREDGTFDVDAFVYAVRLWTVALEISVYMASFPSREIALNTYKYRTLGLGYADLGALLMRQALPYDSDEGRALAAGVTALMTGVAYRTSAEMADELGPFARWEANAEGMRRVLQNHRAAITGKGYIGLTTKPYGVLYDTEAGHSEAIRALKERADSVWGEVVYAKHFRNAQVTVIAPTGTISFVMDCDTTGCEPDYALVKDKKLAGGGDMQLMVNQSIKPALEKTGMYSWAVINSIVRKISYGFTLPYCGVKPEHLSIFYCANEIDPMGHVKMVAAIQPFLSGAASKTVNMPADTPIGVFDKVYREAHRLGVKAIAPYRDGCKLNQPLSAAKAEPKVDTSDIPEADEDWFKKAKLHTPLFKSAEDRMLLKPTRPLTTEEEDEIKKYFETLSRKSGVLLFPEGLARGEREFLPWRRKGDTQKMKLGDDGLTVYLRTGEYPDGRLGEIFIDLAQQGSTLRGAFNCFSIAFSLALQYGAPLDVLVKNLAKVKFEPAGLVEGHEHIKFSSSIADLVARDLALNYLDDHFGADVKRQPEPPLKAVGASVAVPVPTTRLTGQICPNCGELLRQAGTCRICPNGDYDEGCS